MYSQNQNQSPTGHSHESSVVWVVQVDQSRHDAAGPSATVQYLKKYHHDCNWYCGRTLQEADIPELLELLFTPGHGDALEFCVSSFQEREQCWSHQNKVAR